MYVSKLIHKNGKSIRVGFLFFMCKVLLKFLDDFYRNP